MYFQVYITIQIVILILIIGFNLNFSKFLERKLDCEINDCHLSKILMVQLPLILTNISL